MFDRRLQLIVGKGGVGKSAVAASLAADAAAQGLRVLAVELGNPGGMARIFGVETAEPNRPTPVSEGLELVHVEGESALVEYLELLLPMRRLLRVVFENAVYRAFVGAAPGLRELMAVGKLFHEADRRERGVPVWDRIIVDAGASGHSLQYLRMPAAAADTFGSGLVHREAVRVLGLLQDSRVTCVHVVATPEDMPLVEAAEIVERLRAEIGIALGRVVVNRCREPAADGVVEALDCLARVARESEDGFPAALARGVVGAAEDSLAWLGIQERGIAAFRERVEVEPLRLPWLETDALTFAEARSLGEMLRAAESAAPQEGDQP